MNDPEKLEYVKRVYQSQGINTMEYRGKRLW